MDEGYIKSFTFKKRYQTNQCYGRNTSTINSSIGSSRNSHSLGLGGTIPKKKLTLRKGFAEPLSELDQEAIARMSGPGFNDSSSAVL